MQDSPYVAGLSCGSFWPNKTGWYQLTPISESQDKTASVTWRYIESEENWLASQQKMKLNSTYAMAQRKISASAVPVRANYLPINQWLFVGIIFICACIIWTEKKFDS